MTSYGSKEEAERTLTVAQKAKVPHPNADLPRHNRTTQSEMAKQAVAAIEPATTGVAYLQRALGNQALASLAAGHAAGQATVIQAKLTVGPVGDAYEQEADQVAKDVVQQLGSASSQETAQRQPILEEDEALQMKPQSSALQREAFLEDEEELQLKKAAVQREEFLDDEEELQMKPLRDSVTDSPVADGVQRQESMLEDEEELMMKPVVQRAAGAEGGLVDDDVESAIQRNRGGGQVLGDGVRGSMEQAFGADFGGVKIHTSGEADTLNQSLQARAFTTGQDIFFRQGEYNPGSTQGQELLAHELTHVVQQNGPTVRRQAEGVEEEPPSATGYVGLNPKAHLELAALSRYAEGDVLGSLDRPDAEKALDTTEERVAFVYGRLGISPFHFETFFAALTCLEECDGSFREQMADLMQIFQGAESGKYTLERLVLSGHHDPSEGAIIWGDGDSAGELLLDRDLENLAKTFPKAAGQIEDIMFSSCNTRTRAELCARIFPKLESVWVYDGYSPSIKQGSAQHILQWEKHTRGDDLPSRRDAVGNAIVWTKAGGFLGEPE